MGVLDVNHRERGQRGCQQTGPTPVHPAADDVHHRHGTHISQGGQRTAGEPHIHCAPVGKQLGNRSNQHQDIYEDAAQREPVWVERAAFRVEKRSQGRYPGFHLRPLLQPSLVAGRNRQRPEHVIGPQIKRPLVGMEPVAGVPVNPVEPQPQRDQQQRRQ